MRIRLATFNVECLYPRVGWDRPKASDHCLVVVEFEIPEQGVSARRRMERGDAYKQVACRYEWSIAQERRTSC